MSYLLPITLKRFNSVDWKAFQTFISEQIDGADVAVGKLTTQRELLRATSERTENILSQYYQYEKRYLALVLVEFSLFDPPACC